MNEEHMQDAEAFKKSFEENYEKHRIHLKVMISKRGLYGSNTLEDIEDVFQETYIRCYDVISRNGFRKGSKREGKTGNYPVNYFQDALTFNIFNALGVKNKREKKFTDIQNSWRSLLLVDVMDNNENESYLEDHMMIAMEKLPEKYQDILRMVAEGLSYKKITKVLGLTIGQVKMRIWNARKMIISELPEDFKINPFELLDEFDID